MNKTLKTIAAATIAAALTLTAAGTAHAAPRKKPPVAITCPTGYTAQTITIAGATYQWCIRLR